MTRFQKIYRVAGWLTVAIAFAIYFFSVERTGSLWDCGEFVSAAYKLQVVHPPGAPLFILMARMFITIAELFTDDPSAIGHAVNLFSGMATAFAAGFVAWSTALLTKLAMVGRDKEPDQEQSLLAAIGGLIAGLTAAFCTSVWFSAVEGEVYALSTFFTALTIWATVKWYSLPKEPTHDRWLLFAIFAAALSIGVHLLSLLTFPALALFYYFKKFDKRTVTGGALAMLAGVLLIAIIQSIVIVGIPTLWYWFDKFMVNSMSMPANTGIIPTILLLAAAIVFGLRWARKNNKPLVQQGILAFMFAIIGYSTIGVVVIRSNANPPINMNDPSDPSRLLPYINREQYGERPLLFGPYYEAEPVRYDSEDRYGLVDGKYVKVSEKYTPVYDRKDEMFFPRLGHIDARRIRLYKEWLDRKRGKPSFAENIGFFIRYQVNWMYWRYFMWNFVGRQNAKQGFFPWEKKSGNWASGLSFIDEARTHNLDKLPPSMANEKSRNHYYFLPLIFGLIGLLWHYRKRRRDFIVLLTLFIITGLGIIVYSNQPPNEPRERDYVLVGSFMVFAMWVGMAVPAVYEFLKERASLSGTVPVAVAGLLVLSAPTIMAVENFDDHSRRWITAARDYANNYLNSLEKNAIIFTYGDNDTYPLWYAQEVEGIRTDVRVINLSLLGVDWYINQLRRKINQSPPLKLTLSEEDIRGNNRQRIRYYKELTGENAPPRSLREFIDFVAEDQPIPNSSQRIPYLPTKQVFIPVDAAKAISSGWVKETEVNQIVDRIPIQLGNNLVRDELTILDLIANNMYERPIYWAATIQPSKLIGLNDYTQFEGLALRFVPIRTPSQRGMSIYGSGRVAADKVLKNMSEDFKWGNFDKYDLFVDESYAAAVQAHRFVMMRAAQDFTQRNELDKAAQIADLYFEGFPNMNFPYVTHQVTPFIRAYLQNNQVDEAKKHLDILVKQVKEYMEFYNSLDPAELNAGFRREYQVTQSTMNEVISMAQQISPEYADQVREILAPVNPASNQPINQ